MADRHFIAVVNPVGGTRRGMDVLRSVEPVFAAAGAPLEVHVTRGTGHARELARALDLSGCAGLCLVGGDGTLHEAVNGLMQRPPGTAVPLGVIPGGTGNSVAEHLGCTDPVGAARQIIAGAARPLDVLRVTTEGRTAHCVNIVGWGAVVDINRSAERLRHCGTSRYTLAALRHILCPRRRQATITLDRETLADRFLFAVGCNTRFTGKRMNLAPAADMSDGMLDVVLVRQASRWQMLRLFQRVFDGSHIAMPCVEVRQVRTFAIDADADDGLNLDGELTGHAPVSVTVLPGALRIFG